VTSLLSGIAETNVTGLPNIKNFIFLFYFIYIMMGEKRNTYILLVGKPEGKRPLRRQRRRWVDNIRMDLGEVGWDDVDWIGLAQDRNRWRALVNSVLNLRVP
jgi:predicted membrane protein